MVADLTKQLDANDLRFNPPRFGETILKDFLLDQYEIKGDLKPLAGERDQNLRVTADNGKRYVLKIAGPDELDETVDFQIKALVHLESKDPGLIVPRQIKSKSGNQTCILKDESGRPHFARLVSFVDGNPMSEYEHLDFAAIKEVGRISGRLCAALKDFNHPAANHFMPWDSLNGLIFSTGLRQYLPDDFKKLAEEHLQRLQTDSMPKLLALPHQIIHHDAHTGNVMCAPDNPSDVTGVIDFGDLIDRPIVMDLAVSLVSIISHNPDLLGTTTAMLEGYGDYVTIPDEQLELLYDAMAAALIMSVQLLNYRAQHHADDPEKIRQEDFASVLETARTFLEFDRAIFTNHILKHH